MDKETVAGSDRHEKRDIKVGKVAAVGVILLGIIALAGYFIPWFLFDFMSKETDSEGPPPSPLITAQQLPPPPRVQAHPQLDLANLRQAEDNQLKLYSWVDRDNGVVRIPIERAMELLAQRNAASDAQRGATEAAAGDAMQANPDSSSGRFPAPARKQP